MSPVVAHIKDFALLHAGIAYILIFLGVIVEGEIVVILAGIFAHLGSINLFIAVASIFTGGAVKSFLGYNLGIYLKEKHSHLPLLYKTEKRISKTFPNFDKYPFMSIFLSRFLIFSMYTFVLIFNGYKHINLKTFIRAEASSLVVWTMIMLSIGFLFGYAAFSISRDIRNLFLMIIGLFVAFFILERVILFIIHIIETKEK